MRATCLALFFAATAAGWPQSPRFVDVVNPAGAVLRPHAEVLRDANGDYVALGNGFKLYAGADGRLGTGDDVVTGFGHFPQGATEVGTDAGDPLAWRLLDLRDGYAVLMSAVILDEVVFNPRDDNHEWSRSNLRAWLNSRGGVDANGDTRGFLERAFSDAERNKLVLATVDESAGGSFLAYNKLLTSDWWQMFHTSGESTQDRVWALSGEEVFRYFGRSRIATRAELGHDPANYTNAYFVPSAWAHTHGVKVNEGHNGASFVGFGDAWTRSPGAPFDGKDYYGVFLGSTGSLNAGRAVIHPYGVLPVIEVRLSAR